MYIQRVIIENVRGFGRDSERVDIDFTRPGKTPAGWTVLAGRNGSGKSTLLRAMALAISGPSVARSLQDSFAGWVRQGEHEATVSTLLSYSQDDDRFTKTGKLPKEFSAGLRWQAIDADAEPTLDKLREDRGRQAPERGPWSENPIGWFLVGYGPFRRLSGHASDAQRLMVGPQRVARLVSLFREDASLVESVQWLRENLLRRLEQNSTDAEHLERDVIRLLNDGLLPDGMKAERVSADGLWVRRGGVSLPLRELSDGYRTMTALVVDIIRHLYQCYKGFRLHETDGVLTAPYRGVVLIDEIDVHLHISWQQRIGFWLKQHFPNIQFIVTTHSPYICQAADENGLIRLAGFGDPRPAAHVAPELFTTIVNGSADEAAMTELFGLEHAHSEHSEQLRQRVAEIEARIARGDSSTQEQVELRRLTAQLPRTGSATVEQLLLRFAEPAASSSPTAADSPPTEPTGVPENRDEGGEEEA